MRTTVSLLVALCIPGGLQAQTSSVTGPEMQISPEIARLLLASYGVGSPESGHRPGGVLLQ
jgi:hypothetical protein